MLSVLVYVVSPVLVWRWCIGGEGGTVYTVLGNTCVVCALCLPHSDGLHNISINTVHLIYVH